MAEKGRFRPGGTMDRAEAALTAVATQVGLMTAQQAQEYESDVAKEVRHVRHRELRNTSVASLRRAWFEAFPARDFPEDADMIRADVPRAWRHVNPDERGFDGDKQRPSVDHSILSPSGKVSKRSRDAAIERTRKELFTDDEGNPMDISPKVRQETPAENMRRRAAELRKLASRGMSVRKFTKEADRLEAEAAKLSGARGLGAAPGDVDGFVRETTDAAVVHAERMFERAGLTVRGEAGDERPLTARPAFFDVSGLRPDQTATRMEYGRRIHSTAAEAPLWRAEMAYAWFHRQFVRGATGRPVLNASGTERGGPAGFREYPPFHADPREFGTAEARLGLDLWRLGRNVAAEVESFWNVMPQHKPGVFPQVRARVLEAVRARLNWPRLPDGYDPPPPSQWPEAD